MPNPPNAAAAAAKAAQQARARLRGLKPQDAAQLRRAMQLLASGERLLAGQLLLNLGSTVPEHPEVLRCLGQWHGSEGRWERAAACLARSHALLPGDFVLLLHLATAQDRAGDFVSAAISLRAAAGMARNAEDWLALSVEFDRQGCVEDAMAAVQQVLARQPALPIGLLQRARCATALGQAELAAADARALIAQRQLLARAWFLLGDLKIVRLTETELAQLAMLAAAPPPTMPAEDQAMLHFALGKAMEDAGRVEDAFAALQRANAQTRVLQPWDATAFQREVDALRAAFQAAVPPEQPVPAELAAGAPQRGHEVIFLVGLPRSGTTLVEQVLAAHSQVEGASELPYLGRILEQESQRRGRPLAQWAAVATAQDWARLGNDYLVQSARWRARRPVATDKLPDNWLWAGAAMRMLPGARVIDCKRDPVETCWSCFKQLFGPGMAQFSYSFEGLAGYWHAYDGLSRHWAERHPTRFRAQHYEALVAAPESEIRALLAFCGLPFEPGCLEFHKVQRAIRTPSALQVRQPMRAASTPGAAYGALLEPLRALLRS